MESVKKWLNERTMKKNGLYQHYSPPKGVVSAAQLRQWARGGTDSTLERAVLAGQGRRLLAEAESLSVSRHISELVAKCDALHSAVERGSLLELQVLTELLESDYNRRKYVTCRDEAGVGLLHKAVYFDFMDIVQYLVKNYPQLVHQKDSEGRTALHYVAVCRDEAAAAALLEGAGAARGARDASGRTPTNYRGAGRTLLTLPTTDDMARENAKNTPGLVVKRHNIRIWCHDCDMARLQRVVWEGHGARLLSEVSNQHVVKRFLEAVPYIMNTVRDVHNAVVQNDLEDVMKLSSDPVPPQILSSRDSSNMTVMHKAAGLGHVSIMKYIAERYPQGINDVDNDGRTPLHYAAAMRDDQHTYNTLVGLGADESAVDNKNRTPGYYVNRPQEIDRSHLKTIPDAPRTASSAYPTTWDWKLLDNDVIADLNKKSRRRNLKASTENLSFKNNTNTISENTENQINTTIKASSTHELIKDLPELDDSSKLNNEDTDVNIEPEIADSTKHTNIGTETLTEEEHYNNCIRNDDENQDSSHGDNHNDHQDENYDENKTENRNENNDLDQTLRENNDEHHEDHYPNQSEDAKKGENNDENHHSDLNHFEQKDIENSDNHVDNEGENENEINNVIKDKDESKVENPNEDTNTNESESKQIELQAKEIPIETEKENILNQENTKNIQLSIDNFTEDVEKSKIKEKLTENIPINELETETHIASNELSLSNKKEILEGVDETNNLKKVIDGKHEEVLDIEDINRKSATSGKRNVTEHNMLNLKNEEKHTDIVDTGDKDVNKVNRDESIVTTYQEENSNNEKGKEPQFQTECHINNEINQEDTMEFNNTNLIISEASKEKSNIEHTNSVDTKSKENGSAVTNHHNIQHTNQIIDATTEGINKISHNEDDDDVQVQGDNNSEHNDFHLKSTPELSDSGSAKRGSAINGRNTQESLLEGIIRSEAEQGSQDASIMQRGGLPHRDVFVFDSQIDPEVTDLINNANMEMLATLVLNGEGSRLIGRESANTELQAFLDNVPTYMQKINKVHLAAKEGNIKDLQAALDRRKFAIARDPISPNGTTPLHVATIYGKTNIMKYLGGRFPETLSAVDFEGRTALHYAAVLPDNGHYYTLLQHLGANSKDLDDNGKSAEDYYKKPCLLPFDQLLSDFGISEDVVQRMFADKAPSRAGNGHMDIPIFRTEEGRYLAHSLGDPLIKGLTEVANVKPKDPVAFLATFLQNFPDSEKTTFKFKESNMNEENESTESENQMIEAKEVIPAEEIRKARRSAARTATRSHRPIDVITVDPLPVISPDVPEIAISSANRDEHGQSMLHFAAARNHARNALFQLLQESDISLGYRDELYRTARDVSIQANIPENTAEIDKWVLHLAAKGNKDKIMELLLEGYDHILDVVDEDGVSITEVVTQRGDTEMSSLLTSIPAFEESRETLHSAVRRGDLPAVQENLSAVNGRSIARSLNSFARTALHIAVLAQHEDTVAYLAQTYPELLRIGDNLERTPLHYAMGVEKIESLSRILIRAGAKRVLKDLKGRQPSYYFMNKSDILRLKEEEEVY